MSTTDSVTLDAEHQPGGLRIHTAAERRSSDPSPGVFLCAWRGTSLTRHEITDALVSHLLDAGVVVVELDDADCDGADPVDRAAAAYRSLALRDDVDLTRLSMIGISAGALVVSAVASRVEGLASLVLIAPMIGQDMTAADDDDAPATDARIGSLSKLDGPAHAAVATSTALVIDAAADRVASLGAAASYARALENSGVATDSIRLPLTDHDITGDDMRAASLSRVVAFLLNARHTVEVTA